ncbi:MAG: selenium-dependent xanthine dehydrogenase [Firmicutes bacterium]|nr:selenium-dependent xanthine dehydrogenase [Bacillota bacterium]
MSTFWVNGKEVHTERDEKLLPFLRETLGLVSVKNGCNQGACGTCTVLADGKATKACALSTARAEGKHIVTCEGLSAREREVYGFAFTAAGAVQCGFCTPGMVMAAKGCIDGNPSPNRDEVKSALKSNLCRCTGYQKIIDAVLLAAKMFRENTPIPAGREHTAVGDRLLRVDAPDKALGHAPYADDIRLPGMLFGSALRAKYPRARILGIDPSKAKALPGVVCVLTAADIPGRQKVGHLKKDWDVMIPVGGITHYLGDAVALVAAENRETLEQAKALIDVQYEELPAVLSLEAAMSESAPKIHADSPGNLLSETRLKRGDPEAVFLTSKYVVTRHYSTPPTEHAFLEPECAVALPDGDGVLVYSGDQGVWQTKRECAETLGLDPDQVRVVAKMVGGGFGGKEDMSVQHHAALLAYKTGRPVKVALTRDESILIHPKRHGMEIEMTTACDENGKLTAMKAVILTDGGAYASLSGPVLQRSCTHAAGPYNYHNIDILGRAYYSNNPPCGAFRGFGVPQSCFATEMNLNLLAEMAGLTPFEIRYRNAVRPGDVLPNGQSVTEDAALAETLDAVRDFCETHPRAGLACAMKNAGLGVGVPDTGRAKLVIGGALVHIHSSAACVGQGLATVLTQIVCETAKLPLDQVRCCPPDTADSPNAGMTTASRQTVFTGEAVRRAAEQLKEALENARTEYPEQNPFEVLEGAEFSGEYTGVTDPMGSDKENPVSHVGYSYATQVAELDEDGRVKYVLAAHDVGQPVNPLSLEGQIEGGVVMSLGWALTEKFPLENGKPKVKFGTLGLLRADQVPEIESVFVKRGDFPLACGAKGVGEICSIPTAPAVALAYYNYDGVFRTELPLKGTAYSKK